MAEEQADDTFVHGMGLTEAEIDALDRYIGLMEQATKNPKDFARSEAVAFTPGAMLAIAVAEFAYRVYRDYGRGVVIQAQLQAEWRAIAQQLATLEEGGEEALGVDTYARLRKALAAAKRTQSR
jgi:hypothetical protein